MNLQGDFNGRLLTGIMQRLYDEKKTGFLQVTSGIYVSKIIVKDGVLIYAMGPKEENRLGYMLRRDGKITEEQFQKCLAAANEKKHFLGKILVDEGLISLETFKEYHTRQAKEILCNLLLLTNGKYEYNDATLNLDVLVLTELNPMELISEAS